MTATLLTSPGNTKRSTLLTIVMATLAAGPLGCTRHGGDSTLSGTVTLDGQPLPAGEIRFLPADGQAATAGATIKDGKFSAAVSAGDKKVQISAPKVTGKRKMYETPDSPTVDVVEELLPARYNVRTELKITVGPGSREETFELHSK